MALHGAAQVGHRQAALVDLGGFGVERLDHRVDDDRERDRRLVRVARVVVDLDHGYARQLADLVGGQPGAARGAHGRDQVVDELLELRGGQLVRRDLAGAFAQNGVPDGGDRPNAHQGAAVPPRQTRATSGTPGR